MWVFMFGLFWFIWLFCPITSIFSGNKCGSLGPFWLPSSAWPKISWDLRFLISIRIPPAALKPFGHVSLSRDLGIKTWVSSHSHQLVSVNWIKLNQVQECKYMEAQNNCELCLLFSVLLIMPRRWQGFYFMIIGKLVDCNTLKWKCLWLYRIMKSFSLT